jgi:hypothetical protein
MPAKYGEGTTRIAAERRAVETRPRALFEHDLFGKPVPTFPDHAQGDFLSSSALSEFGIEIVVLFSMKVRVTTVEG